MSTATGDLAAEAQAIARRSKGMARTAANCCMIALTYSSSVKSAREALEVLDKTDVREAALELLGRLAGRNPAGPASRLHSKGES